MERKETTLENRGKMIRVEERTGEEREGWNGHAGGEGEERARHCDGLCLWLLCDISLICV